MRHKFFISMLLISFSLGAQSLKEAEKLSSSKKYAEAAEIYYSLGYYGKAAEAFRKHVSVQPSGRRKKVAEALNQKIRHLEQLDRMTLNCENVQIIDSIIIAKSEFLKAYRLSEEAGSLISAGESTIYETQLKDRRYFSESRSGEPSRLYRQTKIQSEWTPPVPVEIPIDSAGSDAFPFIMPDGLTLYFASTGNGSIGGYDIFAARYNLSNSTYLTPSQLGMPFNSTSNDYLYAIDESKGVGYFATDRFQEEGKVIIYTFIPNESFKPIERATIDRLVSRARINSIRDTWPEGSKGNTSLKETEHYPTAVKKDFTFVINDNIVYHIPKDFESDAARRSWQAAKDATIQINELEEQIDSLRLNYSLGNRQQRRTLMPKILSAESKLEQLHRQCREKTKEARNLEIRSLRMK